MTQLPAARPTSIQYGGPASNTTAGAHHNAMHQDVPAELLALVDRLGVGATSPVANTVLLGTGTGTSAFGAITSAYLVANAATKVAHADLTTTDIFTAGSTSIAARSLTEFITLVSGGGDLLIVGHASVYTSLPGTNVTLRAALLNAAGTSVILAGPPSIVTLNHSGVYYPLTCLLHVPSTTTGYTAGTTYAVALQMGATLIVSGQSISSSGGNGEILVLESRR